MTVPASPPVASPAPPRLSHREILIVFSGLMLGMLLAALDQTIVATALPTIVGDLGGLDHLSWVVTAYLLTSTASTPLYGKVSDLVGRKVVFQAAITIFLAGSALSGLSQTMGQLIAFRAVQGLGAGGLMAMAMAIIGDIVSPRERGRYQGYTGAVFAFSSVAGPLAGGFFVDHLSWRWVFYVNLPIGVAALVVTSVVLRLPVRRLQHKVDYLGSALLVGAVTCLLLVSVWGGSEYAWGSPTIAGLTAAGVLLVGGFVIQERRAAEPVLPLRLFRNPIFSVTSAAAVVVGASMFGAIVYMPLYLQVVNGASPTTSGLQLTPLMVGVIIGSVGSGRIISRRGRYKAFPVAGTAIMTAGLFLLSRLDAHTSRPAQVAAMAVVGLGVGLVMQVLVLAVQNSVAHRDLGTATSASSFFRSMGGAFGVAVYGSILNSGLAERLANLAPAGVAVDPAAVQGGPDALRSLPPAAHAAVVEAFARSLHSVFLAAVPIALAGFVIVLFLKELPLRDSAHVGLEGLGEAGVFEPAEPDTEPARTATADPQPATVLNPPGPAVPGFSAAVGGAVPPPISEPVAVGTALPATAAAPASWWQRTGGPGPQGGEQPRTSNGGPWGGDGGPPGVRPAPAGQPVALRASVVSAGAGSPTGTVTFAIGDEILAVAALAGDGTAVATVTLRPGRHAITARYDGDDHHAASRATVDHAVGVATRTILDGPHAASRCGEPVTLTAFVSFLDPAVDGPTGTVTFTTGAETIGVAPVDSAGRAIITVALAPGTYALSATYSGDDRHATSTSRALTHTVQPAATTITLTVETDVDRPSEHWPADG
jgi:EmrB/QacA subfamily drug resistance transporter